MFELLLTDCRNLIKTFPNCSIAHVFRETNCCADYLAFMGTELNSDFQFLYNPPSVTVDFLAKVKVGFVCYNTLRASVATVAKIMPFYHTKGLLDYFITSFYNISFIRYSIFLPLHLK